MMLKDLTSPSRWIVRRVARDRLDLWIVGGMVGGEGIVEEMAAIATINARI
jgi:hypothetical protein